MYLEIMGSDNWFNLAFFASAFLGAVLGTIFICDYIGTLIGMFLGIIVLGGVTNPIMVKQAECLAKLPYQQEKAAIIETATNIDCCLYRDSDGQYFFLHEFNVSEKDYAENGPKFIRVDIPDDKANLIMGEIALMAENHDCNNHFDFEPYETEFRTKFLAEHPEMADDYEEKLRIQLAGNAEQLAFNLYKDADKYFMLNDTLTERVYISKETADSILEANQTYLERNN